MAILDGLMLLVILGIICAVWFALVDPIVAIEADEQNKVLRRSRELTEGFRWEI